MCDVTHWYVWHDAYICEVTCLYVWRGSFICVTWLIHMCVTWLIHMYDVAHCDMTHSYVWRGMTHSYVWRGVTWLIHMYDVAHSYVWHDSFWSATWLFFDVRHHPFICVNTCANNNLAYTCTQHTHTHTHAKSSLHSLEHICVYNRCQTCTGIWAQHTATHRNTHTKTISHSPEHVHVCNICRMCSGNWAQHTATHRNTPQHTATHHSTPQHTHHSNFAQSRARSRLCNTPQHTAGVLLCVVPKFLSIFCIHCTTHCNTLQHTATHCNTLQHTATHCNTLQHTHQKNFAQSWARPWHLLRSAHSRPTAPAPAPRVARAACPHTCTRVTRMLHICNTHTTSGACGLATYLYMCYTYVTGTLHVYYLYVTRRSAPAPLVARAACPHICICGTHMLQVRYTYITHM